MVVGIICHVIRFSRFWIVILLLNVLVNSFLVSVHIKQLPVSTISGLHQIKDGIWAYDYTSCLSHVNQLVSTGSFSVLSQFIPGIKVLLQVSSQLGVYIEKR